MSYTKLFSSIVTSTIWTEDANTCKIWVTMLAIADKHGEVHASIPGLAQIAGMGIADAESAIHKFLSPDKYSRTSDDEGRRIEPINGGWLLLNHAKYRAMASKDEEKSANSERQAKFRERQKRNGKVTESNGKVTESNEKVTGSNEKCGSVTSSRDIAEAEAEAKEEEKEEEKEKESPPLTPQGGILPVGWKKMTKSEQSRKKVNSNSPEMIRIGKFFGQRESTLWTIAECVALNDVAPSKEDLDLIEDHYSYEIPENNGYRFTTIHTLLNNWSSARAKAVRYFEENPSLRAS